MTKVERHLLHFIFAYLKDHGYPPGYGEMLVALREHHPAMTLNEIYKMLIDLINMRYVEMPNGFQKPRALRLVWVSPEEKVA